MEISVQYANTAHRLYAATTDSEEASVELWKDAVAVARAALKGVVVEDSGGYADNRIAMRMTAGEIAVWLNRASGTPPEMMKALDDCFEDIYSTHNASVPRTIHN